jgi:hypothetical protein
MDDIGRLAWRIFSRFVGQADEPAPGPRPAAVERREVSPLPIAAE